MATTAFRDRTAEMAGKRAIWPLQLLNFFMADFQAGIGPFLAVFLAGYGWNSGPIGSVMTIGGIAGLLAMIPAGALVDSSKHKRIYVVAASGLVALATAYVLFFHDIMSASISQIVTGAAGVVLVPAVNGITLGLVHAAGFDRQNGINQAFNHTGNMVGAALGGYLGWRFGIQAIFWLTVLFCGLAVVSVLLIPGRAIDDRAARGLGADERRSQGGSFAVLIACKPLVILAVALAVFHLGNAAMLPLYGLAVVTLRHDDPASFVATTVVVAQAVMVLASLLAMWMAEREGLWLVLLISFIALPLRGIIAAVLITHWGVFPVQILDGVGAGLQSVAVPGLVARILNGTGHVNAGLGAVMTAQNIGAALSPAIGGWMAQQAGYGPMFLILGSMAVLSIFVWTAYAGLLRPACRPVVSDQGR